jgi:hypothetical protein
MSSPRAVYDIKNAKLLALVVEEQEIRYIQENDPDAAVVDSDEEEGGTQRSIFLEYTGFPVSICLPLTSYPLTPDSLNPKP